MGQLMWAAAWIGGIIGWIALWALLFARCVATKDGDAYVARMGMFWPGFVVSSALGAFLSVPYPSPTFHSLTLWIHHAAIGMLLVFLILSEFLQIEARVRERHPASREAVAASYRRLWVLTETVPGPVALAILLTGLRLIWERPHAQSPAESWLVILILGFSIFFWDGLLGFTPIVRRAWMLSAGRIGSGATAPWPPMTNGGSAQLFAHFVSLLVLIPVGLYRPNFANFASDFVAALQIKLGFLPGAWPQVCAALAIWLSAGALVFLVRTLPGYKK